MSAPTPARRRALPALTALLVAGGLTLSLDAADPKKPDPAAKGYGGDGKQVPITPEAWKKAPGQPLTPAELDQLLAKEQKADKIAPSPLTTDEQFLRRVSLDLTGKLPLPADVKEFAADPSPGKRARLIDQLLASDEFAHHWARFLKDVVISRATDPRVRAIEPAYEGWLYEQLKANKSWAEMARAMITATGEVNLGDNSADAIKNGAVGFLLCHTDQAEAANERAAETARVFLGIQIQCAQCHDHPSDLWKRNQFHELAAYYARTAGRLIPQQRMATVAASPRRGQEHQMPDLKDPKKSTTIHPRFLTGETTPQGLEDAARRRALADLITARDNYWFAAAFPNRVWGALMGQAFYQPVDNMGPLQDATYPNVLLRLAAHFRATNYDVKGLLKLVLNSDAYQRQLRPGEDPNAHHHFASAYPARLRADTLWDALVGALGPIQGAAPPVGRVPGPLARGNNFQRFFEDTFTFDPSARADEVEGSVPQALMLMNNPAIAQKMKAAGNTVLERILKANPSDDAAVEMVYLRVLARKPTARERETSRAYVKKVGNRAEAFEDLLWALINSAEFQTRR